LVNGGFIAAAVKSPNGSREGRESGEGAKAKSGNLKPETGKAQKLWPQKGAKDVKPKRENNQGTKAQRESGNQREFFRANGSDL